MFVFREMEKTEGTGGRVSEFDWRNWGKPLFALAKAWNVELQNLRLIGYCCS